MIKQEPDPTRKYPESKLYIGVLVNDGGAGLPLNAIQLPGGYVGSGTFFNCSIQEWNTRKRSWVNVRTTELKGFTNPQIDQILVKPREERAVCRQMLPHEIGRAGSCVRFQLEESWESRGRRWISAPFRIGEVPGVKSCP